MKRITKKITACFVSAFMLCAGTCAAFISASAANDAIQPRGEYHVYGDVNDDGKINIADAVLVSKAVGNFENLTGDTKLPVSYAIAKPAVYFGEGYYVPQAADVDGDRYITKDDATMIQKYIVSLYDEAGRCGQTFYIN